MNYGKELDIQEIVLHALREDRGVKDITTDGFIRKDALARAALLAKQDCVVCGLGVASLVFKTQDERIAFIPLVKEGSAVKKGKVIARISGKAKSLLTAERTALNFISFLSGVATKTRRYVEAAKPYPAKILDTRKTIPGLRLLEKYAVRIGGGFNHRLTLDEMIMVKDNHIKVAGLRDIVARVKKSAKRPTKVEIEVGSLKEFKAVIQANPDVILLDNMPYADIKKAVAIRNSLSCGARRPKPLLEASGGITLKNLKRIASARVDMISVGSLTHSVDSVDISLEIR